MAGGWDSTKLGLGEAATDVAILLRASRCGPRPLTASTLMRASHKRLPRRQRQHPAHVGSDTELTRSGTKVPFMIHCDVFPARLDPWGPGHGSQVTAALSLPTGAGTDRKRLCSDPGETLLWLFLGGRQ